VGRDPGLLCILAIRACNAVAYPERVDYRRSARRHGGDPHSTDVTAGAGDHGDHTMFLLDRVRTRIKTAAAIAPSSKGAAEAAPVVPPGNGAPSDGGRAACAGGVSPTCQISRPTERVYRNRFAATALPEDPRFLSPVMMTGDGARLEPSRPLPF
jgi:hypothetical protein